MSSYENVKAEKQSRISSLNEVFGKQLMRLNNEVTRAEHIANLLYGQPTSGTGPGPETPGRIGALGELEDKIDSLERTAKNLQAILDRFE